MSKWRIDKAALTALHRYREDIRGTMSVELVLVLPLLFWAYIAMIVFYDAYRARMEAQAAALHVADLVSRQSQTVTTDYLEGMNDVYDFLTTRNRDTRLRISSLMWVEDRDDPQVAWSYGTRGLPSLLDLSLASFGGGDGDGDDDGPAPSGFSIVENQMPVADLVDRIPQVLPGEALILVEAFTLWRSPIISWMGFDYLNHMRFTPLAVTRPRFSPFIRYEGDNDVYPEGPPEFLPPVGDPPPPEEEEVEPEPEITTVTVVNNDFNSGDTTGWSIDRVTATHTRSFLGPFGQETLTTPVTYQVNLGASSSSAQIQFDLFIIDSWDGRDPTWARPEGEHLMIQVNGSSIAAESFMANPWGIFEMPRNTVASRAEGRFTTSMELIQRGQIWGSGWDDQVWRVTIDIENPVQAFTLGFSANLNEPIDNEAFGFMNFRITAERGSHGPAHFVPNQVFHGDGMYNRFPIFRGCPDHRIAAQTHSVRMEDLWTTFRHRVRAQGTTLLNNCSGSSGGLLLGTINFLLGNNYGYVHASSSLVVEYDRQGANWNGSRLRIRTEDGNNGSSCNTNLLVRDPTGAAYYNRNINNGFLGIGANRNSILDLGFAPSGTYHIWVMRDSSGACNSDIILENY